jgi:predicted ATPase
VSSFVGREDAVAEIEAALATARLVTLTGAGGVGKTRLSIRVGEQLAPDYPDGVWFVELAGLAAGADLALVAQTVAQVLGVREQPGRPLLDTLRESLRPKRLLLILDNCEHLLAASAALAAFLLEAAPELRVLATSRQSLGITGEADWRVPSLAFPGVGCWVLGPTRPSPTLNT